MRRIVQDNRLARHCNVAKFASRISSIENYNKHTFDYKQHFQFITRQSSVSAAAARARNEAAAKRHAVLSELNLPSDFFSSPSITFPPTPFSPSSISAPVSHLDHVIESFHLPPPLSPIPEMQTDSDNNTDTFTPDTSQTDQQVPHIRDTLQTSPVADNTLPLQTDFPNFPSMPTLAQILQISDITPTEALTDTHAHTDANSDTDTEHLAPLNDIHDTTLASVTPWIHLFPDLTLPNQKLAEITLQAQWLANLLLSFTQSLQLPPRAMPIDRTLRRLMMATGFWPSNLDINADLNQLLVTLLASYYVLLERSTRNN